MKSGLQWERLYITNRIYFIMSYKKVAEAVYWGFKNLDSILRLASLSNACESCSESPSEGDDFCSEHRGEYDRLVENGPW